VIEILGVCLESFSHDCDTALRIIFLRNEIGALQEIRDHDVERLVGRWRELAVCGQVIDLLLDAAGVSPESLARIRLAGNFGSGLDIRKTMRLGLIPELPMEKVDVVGNAALRGAALALVSREYRDRAARIHRRCKFLELAARPDFQVRFASSMFF